ncbi:MAG: ABC transporter ATP-binding protein [Clostridia bacterium]|nr:ABC transporter ATP-binding protein [Clostridia bacterium]
MNNILYANKISKSFDGNFIFRDLSISLQKGETLALLGPSGIGKTTLLNILSGVLAPDSGNVYLKGEDITAKPGHISYMQQKDLLLPYYTVAENVALPLIIKGEKKNVAIETVKKHFEFFGISGYENKYPKEMSGGMKQRAALLRTVIQSQGVILLDEPFGALDAVTRNKMQKWYLDIKDQMKISTIIITHDTDEALILADRIIVMKDSLTIKELKVNDKCKDFELTKEFLQKKKEVLGYL